MSDQHDPRIYGAWADLATLQMQSRQWQTLSSTDLAAFWRRCSLSADFWANYTALFIGQDPPAGQLRRSAMKDVLAYLLNELFENCAKFSCGSIAAVRYEALIGPEVLSFQFTNHIAPERQAAFEQFIHDILTGDPDQLYFQRLEEQAESNTKGSGLGYLTLIKDYGVQFGFRFQRIAEASVCVDVQAHVSRQEI
jgi:hypothetical protein